MSFDLFLFQGGEAPDREPSQIVIVEPAAAVHGGGVHGATNLS
ncbi:MAG: hypothetical protein AAFX06_30515 [Planctomycetota bacterium]